MQLLLQLWLARMRHGRRAAIVDCGDRRSGRSSGCSRAGSDIVRAIVAPPGVAAGTVAVLRGAFMAAMRDARLLADVQKSAPIFDPLAGARLQSLVARAVRRDAAGVETARKFSAPSR